MKNLINVCVVSLAVMLSSLMLALPAPALQGLTGIDALMGVPCITNWIRVAPHQCFATVFPSPVALVTDGVCRALDLTISHGIPTTSKLGVFSAINTGSLARIYTNSGCTGNQLNIFNTETQYVFPMTAGQLYYLATAGAVNVYPVVYFD